MTDTTVILGGPGCGKTTALLNIIESYLGQGIGPDKIAFISYTRKAAHEAVQRACDKFGLPPSDFPYFKTIHALAYTELGVRHNEVMGRQDYKRFAELMDVEFTGYTETGQVVGGKVGDTLLNLVNLAHATQVPLKQIWRSCNDDINWYQLQQFAMSLQEYKRTVNKLDFNDLLTEYNWPIPVEVGIIDEAQDLSLAQWQVANNALRNVKHRYIAGDDDQAIHKWAGASVDTFLHLPGEKHVLPKSHRLPVSVFHYANRIVHNISNRYDKQWTPTDKAGTVKYINDLDELDFKGEWYILARNSWHLRAIKSELRQRAIPFCMNKDSSINSEHVQAILLQERYREGYELNQDEKLLLNSYSNGTDSHWYDALTRIPRQIREYYRSVMRNGYKLTDKPGVYIGTIHSVKGGEADNVLVLSDVTYRTSENIRNSPDDEHRCFYVAVTRAKENLYIKQSDSYYNYPL